MFHIAGVMLADANTSASKDDLNAYIKKKFQRLGHHFVMTTREKYIVITKNDHFKESLYDFKTKFIAN
jgi:hypothetical protein